MVGKRVVSDEQINELVAIMRQYPERASGQVRNVVRTPAWRREHENFWKQLALQLNGLSGCVKSAEKWKNYWHELKYRVNKMVLDHTKKGVPMFRQNLKPYQKEILKMIKLHRQLKNESQYPIHKKSKSDEKDAAVDESGSQQPAPEDDASACGAELAAGEGDSRAAGERGGEAGEATSGVEGDTEREACKHELEACKQEPGDHSDDSAEWPLPSRGPPRPRPRAPRATDRPRRHSRSRSLSRSDLSFAVVRGEPTPAQRFLDERLRTFAAPPAAGAGAGQRAPDEVPLTELIYRCMLEQPQDTHLINGTTGESFTNDQIVRRAVRLARALAALGGERGERGVVMCVMRNTEHLVTLYYGALFAGYSVFLLDPHSTHLELSHFLPLVEPTVVACDADRLADVSAAVHQYGRVPHPVLAHDRLLHFASGHDDDVASFMPATVDPESCAVLLPTSGSTGLAKAAVITHRALLAQLPSLWCHHSVFPGPESRAMFMSTAQWMTFTNMLTTCPVYRVTVIVTPDKTLPTVLRVIETFKPTWLLLVPGTATALSEAASGPQLASLQRVVVTGAAPAPHTLRKLASIATNAVVANSYGMTEASGFAAIADRGAPFASPGKIFNIFHYKLVDEDGKEVTRGTKGELWLKSNCMIKSYANNLEAYRECAAEGGWWRTGDVFTEDSEGNLAFVERKRFWFKYLNYHISPEELEGVVGGVAGVHEVAVCASERGAAAIVVCAPGARVAREDIHAAVDSKLIEYKRLRGGIAFVDSLPHTHSGKLHRADCARLIHRLIQDNLCY